MPQRTLEALRSVEERGGEPYFKRLHHKSFAPFRSQPPTLQQHRAWSSTVATFRAGGNNEQTGRRLEAAVEEFDRTTDGEVAYRWERAVMLAAERFPPI
jgi:hypothetical protein